MDLQCLPNEIFTKFIEQLVLTIGPFKSIKLRMVNSKLVSNGCYFIIGSLFSFAKSNAMLTRQIGRFNYAIVDVICSSQIIPIDDPALSYGYAQYPSSFKARVILAQAKAAWLNMANGPREGPLFGLADIMATIDNLSPREHEDEAEGRQLAMAGAVAESKPEIVGARDPKRLAHMAATRQDILCAAVVLGDPQLVRNVLHGPLVAPYDRQLVDVNAESDFFGLPLHVAAAYGHSTVFCELLDCGADPHIKDADDGSGNLDFYPDLEPHLYNAQRSTLHVAALGGNQDIVRVLMDLGSEDGISTPQCFRAMIAATAGGHLECLKLLLHAPWRTPSELPLGLGQSLFWHAARYGWPDLVRFLLHEQKLPIDINEQVGGATPRDTALSMAALRGNLQMVELLLGYGADPDLVPWHRSMGQNAIELAARGGHINVLSVLLGASKDEQSPARAFRAASRAAQVRTLRWLMARWGDIAWRETSKGGGQVGRLALVYAIVDPAPDVVRFLVTEAGVPLNEGHEDVLQGRLPVAIAKIDGSRWIYELLLRLGAEDVEVDEEEHALNDRWEGFESETGPVCGIRGVAVRERTWQWV